MKQFTFEAKQKTVLRGMMGLGILCLILSYFTEPSQIAEAGTHMRFWSNFLHNSVFFTGMAFMTLFVLAAFTTAYAGWHAAFKRIWEAYSLFLIPGIVLMVIIGIAIFTHFTHLYHWSDDAAVASDKVLTGKSAFLNIYWYLFGTIIIAGTWAFFAKRMRALSLKEDEDGANVSNFSYHRKTRVLAAIFLPIAAFTGPALIWQWIMSVDAHWYSTLYAWYCMAGWFLAACSLTIILLIYLKTQGYFEQVTKEHLHDLGKYMFAFSIFWTYCWFSQYMLIWYGNLGEETVYFRERLDSYPVLFYGNLVINFVLPFLILMRNTTKRRYGTLVFTSLLVFIGHWWDLFYMIKPGTFKTAQEVAQHGTQAGSSHEAAASHASAFVAGFTIPGLIEIGVLIGFLGFFVYFVFSQLAKASLVPENDPYLEESLHHEVQSYE
ncbi:MAG: hypothetical protein EPO28_03610 [Saprospiraceae bacterium]|nr:MAG: hypothetical protein EPO28_03610 [Saprospiraceae bacterium]